MLAQNCGSRQLNHNIPMDGIYDWNVYARELPSVRSENHHPLMLNIIALKREGFESSDFKNFQVR